MRVELHCHSQCSDGSLPPEEVGERAAAAGVQIFCLTDHDTLEGGPRAHPAFGEDVRLLDGLELSCKHYGKTVHLLCYGVQAGESRAALEQRLARIREQRIARVHAIVDRFAALGILLDPQRILAGAHGTPGRPHVAKVLVDLGIVANVREAFDRYLHDGGPAYVDVDRVSLDEGLAMGRACGARMSLAHPHTQKEWAIVDEMYRMFRSHGLEGIEAYYGAYGPERREPWLRLAERYDLVVTGGSDFHGEANPDITRLGVDLPEPHASRLVEWLA